MHPVHAHTHTHTVCLVRHCVCVCCERLCVCVCVCVCVFLNTSLHCGGAGHLLLLRLVHPGPLGLPYLPGCFQFDHQRRRECSGSLSPPGSQLHQPSRHCYLFYCSLAGVSVMSRFGNRPFVTSQVGVSPEMCSPDRSVCRPAPVWTVANVS